MKTSRRIFWLYGHTQLVLVTTAVPTLCVSLTASLRHIIHPLVQSTVLTHSANVVSGIPNCCFNAGILIA